MIKLFGLESIKLSPIYIFTDRIMNLMNIWLYTTEYLQLFLKALCPTFFRSKGISYNFRDIQRKDREG